MYLPRPRPRETDTDTRGSMKNVASTGVRDIFTRRTVSGTFGIVPYSPSNVRKISRDIITVVENFRSYLFRLGDFHTCRGEHTDIPLVPYSY
jgi:hypothetical protein